MCKVSLIPLRLTLYVWIFNELYSKEKCYLNDNLSITSNLVNFIDVAYVSGIYIISDFLYH